MTIAREGYSIIFGILFPGLIFAALYSEHHLLWLFITGLFLIVLGLFCVAFFRNPRRVIPDDDSLALSPADGKVLAVREVEDEFVGKAYRVDIFLSVFNVHLNRMPVSGKIEFVKYRPGKFISAFKDKASEDNERTEVGISGSKGNFRVVQIAGLVARRIVCYLKDGDSVQAGQLYGLIKFGSRAEITFPIAYQPQVQVGQHVKGGESIIGRVLKND